MSEYADIKIGNMTLWTFRNYLDSYIVSKFFNINDLYIDYNYIEDTDDEDCEPCTKYVYRTNVLKAKERLEAQGFTLSKFECLFKENLFQAIDYSAFLRHMNKKCDEYDIIAKKRIEKYNITFKQWENAIKKIVTYEVSNGNLNYYKKDSAKKLKEEININTESDKIIFYSLLGQDVWNYFYGIRLDIIDYAYIFRLILETFNDEDEITLDFTYLQYWSEESIEEAISENSDIEKTIVLVEGTSDKDILEFSMKQLYPHLTDLFYFMDFDDNNGKRDGGTSYVVKNMKTFYFSKIKVNFIAIFDNDAEGYKSRCELINDIKSWPSNFKNLLYPDVDILRKYPTIAPNGTTVYDNINKKAASIELYLPDSIIKKEGEYYPIEWEARKKIKNNGKEESLYQGVISHKEDIKNDFHKMKNEIISGKTKFNKEEWGRMQKLLETIIFAYR